MNWLLTSEEPSDAGQYLCLHEGQLVVGVYLKAGLPIKAGWYFYRPSDGGLLPFSPDRWSSPRLSP
jgi:hypothetical protein